MRRLDRYVLQEVLGPLGLGFLVYTFILLLQFLFKSAEMIIRRGVALADVGKLLALTLPNILVLTIPMAFLFGILVAIGRLASDSELVAMRSCGVSLFYLYRPILLLSLVLMGVNTFLMVYLLPRGNSALQQLRIDLLTKSASQQVQPRVFYEEWEGLVLYVFDAAPGKGGWRGVFLAEDVPTAENQVTYAERGWVEVDAEGRRPVLHLENAVTHKVDFNRPQRYETTSHRRLQRFLEDRYSGASEIRISAAKGLRELTLGELRERIDDRSFSRQLRNLARVEIHKKFAIPAACLVFGLFALPLGFNNRRGGKSSGFALSIAVILAYYVLLSNGEEAARIGKMVPWLAMWLPNLVLTAAGLFLLARRNRDKSLLLSNLDRWIRQRLWPGLYRLRARRELRRKARRAGGPEVAPDVVVRLPRFRLRFPNILDRYIIRVFSGVFVLVLLSGLAVYVIADLSDNMDDILNQKVPWGTVLGYYKYLSLQIFYDIAPIVVLVTTLITFALLSRTNEVTAAKALGLSLYRLAVPAVVAAAVVSLLCTFLDAQILPASNAQVAQIHDQIKGRQTPRTYRRADRQWLFGQGRYIYNYLHYDSRRQALQRLQVFEFDERARLTRRLFAESARYVGGAWVFTEGWARSFDGILMRNYTPFSEPKIVDYPETPAYFEAEPKPPEQMSYRELRDYIEQLKESGQAIPELQVELHSKLAFPLVCLVMALVALPFAFRLGRRGALYGVGVAVVLGMVFLGIFAFFTKLGETGALPAAVAVWSPNVAFALLSLYLFLGIRT